MRRTSQSECRIGAILAVLIAITGLAAPSSAYGRRGHTERFNLSSSGDQATTPTAPDNVLADPWCFDGDSLMQFQDITPSGRFVAFQSRASNLVAGDTNQVCDIFVRDRARGRTERVSISSDGTEASFPPLAGGALTPKCFSGSTFGPESMGPSISANGRFVAFYSAASDLVPGDTNLACDVFVHDRKTGWTQRVSIASDGSQTAIGPDGIRPDSLRPSLSGDGRLVVFESAASDLVAGDTNGRRDIFLHDRRTGSTQRVSARPDGTEADRHSNWPFVSRDGRSIVFQSSATNLPSDNHNPTGVMTTVFLHDRTTGELEVIAESRNGVATRVAGAVGRPISDDGRFVVFVGTGHVPNDSNQQAAGFPADDVYVRDRTSGRVERVSVRSTGEEAEGNSGRAGISISPEGRFVTFESVAPNLFASDTNTTGSVSDTLLGISDKDSYVYDRKTGALEWTSVAPDGKETRRCADGDPRWGEQTQSGVISSQGRYVTFGSCSPDVVNDDTNERWDLFIRDRGLPLSVGELASTGQAVRIVLDGAPAFSRTGTAWIKDKVSDTVLSKLPALELIGARISYRPLFEDIYVVLELDEMPRSPALAAVTAGSVFGMSLQIDGNPYEVRSKSTGLGPSAETTAAFGLFSCSDIEILCAKVADLSGGFGTTGERISFSVPLDDLRIEDGSIISEVRAFAGFGTFLSGVTKVTDATSTPGGM